MSSRHLVTGSLIFIISCSMTSEMASPTVPSSSAAPNEVAETAEQVTSEPEVTDVNEQSQTDGSASPRASALVAVATWSNVTSTPTCFFFSGPEQLGRNDHLGSEATWATDGGSVTLDFGERIRFRGTLTAGNVTLLRRSSHDFGSKWDVEEQIIGTISGNLLAARYEYHECNTANPGECPSECEITAQLTIRLP